MIRAILFDLDGTLLDRETSFRHFVVSQYAKFGRELGHLPRESYVSRVVALDDGGALWKDKVYQAVIEEFSIKNLSWQNLFEDFDSRIAEYYVPFPGLRAMLDELRMSGYGLGIISNGRSEFQMRSIRTLAIEQDFGAILILEAEGIRKPDPEIFLRALQRLNCPPHESVFVGDNITADIQGARGAGMKTVWKRNNASDDSGGADAVITELAQLPPILKRFV